MRIKTLRSFLLISCLIVLSACTPDWETPLAENQAKWASQHIAHYRMSIDRSGYGDSFAITVEVKDGTVISMVDSQSKKELPKDSTSVLRLYRYLFTVSELFAYVSQTYSQHPPIMQVTYDQAIGYPTKIYINPYTEPCCQDITINVQDFQILSP